MYVGRDFDPIDSGLEADVFTIDFGPALAAGETIVSVIAALAVLEGTDPSSASRLSGAAAYSGTKVSQLIDVRAAPAGVYYRLTFVIATTARPALALWSHFRSRSPN